MTVRQIKILLDLKRQISTNVISIVVTYASFSFESIDFCWPLGTIDNLYLVYSIYFAQKWYYISYVE